MLVRVARAQFSTSISSQKFLAHAHSTSLSMGRPAVELGHFAIKTC